MQINTVPAGTGARWLLDGWRIFRKQPLGLSAMTVVYLMMLFVPALIPFIGLAISGVLGPFATVGLMLCVREAAGGRPPNPALFGQPFKEERPRVNLFRLGLLNAALLLTVASVAALLAPDAPAPAPGQPVTLEDLPVQALLLQLLLYAPVLVLMWFAPLLAGWHGMTPAKAMFGSVVACWRNMAALTIYGLLTLSAMVAVSFFFVALVSALLSREAMSFVIAPLALVMMSVIQSSYWPMYRSVFEALPAIAVAAAPEDEDTGPS